MTQLLTASASDMLAPILIEPTVTKLHAHHRGCVLVAGSHGGKYAAFMAAYAGVRAVLLSDAGIGLSGAGVAGVLALDEIADGIPAAAVDVWSARIGDGGDMFARGRISTVNRRAKDCGCRVGMPVEEAALLLQAMSSRLPVPVHARSKMEETRYPLHVGDGNAFAPAILALDSAALVRESDAGAFLVLGSHGGMPGPTAFSALMANARVAAFNDAGIGIDNAGLSRLPVLDTRGIAAVTVSARTARIGEAMSSWNTGLISAANSLAQQMGARMGERLQDFYLRLHKEETR